MGGRVNDVLLGEAQPRQQRRGIADHPGAQGKQILGDQGHLLPALVDDDRPRVQPLLLADRLRARARPAALEHPGDRRDVGPADADAQLGAGTLGGSRRLGSARGVSGAGRPSSGRGLGQQGPKHGGDRGQARPPRRTDSAGDECLVHAAPPVLPAEPRGAEPINLFSGCQPTRARPARSHVRLGQGNSCWRLNSNSRHRLTWQPIGPRVPSDGENARG